MTRILSATFVALGICASFLSHQSPSRHTCYLPTRRHGLSSSWITATKALTKWMLFTWNISSLSVCTASGEDIDQDVEDEFLKEILAEEQREAEELAKLEAEMRELEALKAQHAQMHQNNPNKMKPGGGGGGKKTNMNMPGGATSAQFQQAEEQLRKKEAEAAEAKRLKNAKATEDMERKKAKEVAAKREAEYKAELERLQDEAARKALQRKKQRDGKMVRKIIRQSEKGRHYSVLGMKCKWGEIKLGPLRICNVSQGDIKRAYRTAAKVVHPDKNRDGRAPEAFRALEKSAEVLMDSKLKKEYDAILMRQRKEMMDRWGAGIKNTIRTTYKIFKLLGPFATPITILLALII